MPTPSRSAERARRETRRRAGLRVWATVAALSPQLLLGCGPPSGSAERATPWNAPPQGLRGAASGTRAERFFPLVDGYVYHYATTTETGEEGILIARVHRSGDREGQLRFPSGVKRFEYTAEGIRIASTGAFVLKEPIELGASWLGEHGGQTKIIATDAVIEVPAGRFSGCLQTLEERLGDRPVRYISTFCPDVGVVSLEAASRASYEKAELKSYAPPMDMGPDGVHRTVVTPEAPAGGL